MKLVLVLLGFFLTYPASHAFTEADCLFICPDNLCTQDTQCLPTYQTTSCTSPDHLKCREEKVEYLGGLCECKYKACSHRTLSHHVKIKETDARVDDGGKAFCKRSNVAKYRFAPKNCKESLARRSLGTNKDLIKKNSIILVNNVPILAEGDSLLLLSNKIKDLLRCIGFEVDVQVMTPDKFSSFKSGTDLAYFLWFHANSSVIKLEPGIWPTINTAAAGLTPIGRIASGISADYSIIPGIFKTDFANNTHISIEMYFLASADTLRLKGITSSNFFETMRNDKIKREKYLSNFAVESAHEFIHDRQLRFLAHRNYFPSLNGDCKYKYPDTKGDILLDDFKSVQEGLVNKNKLTTQNHTLDKSIMRGGSCLDGSGDAGVVDGKCASTYIKTSPSDLNFKTICTSITKLNDTVAKDVFGYDLPLSREVIAHFKLMKEYVKNENGCYIPCIPSAL